MKAKCAALAALPDSEMAGSLKDFQKELEAATVGTVDKIAMKEDVQAYCSPLLLAYPLVCYLDSLSNLAATLTRLRTRTELKKAFFWHFGTILSPFRLLWGQFWCHPRSLAGPFAAPFFLWHILMHF